MTKLSTVVGALVGAFAVMALGAYCGHSSESAELRSLRASADSASRAARTAEAAAVGARARADSVTAVNERTRAERDSLRTVAAQRRVVYERLARQAPDTCAEVVAAADSALAAADSARESVEMALQRSQGAEMSLRQGYDSLTVANGLLRASERDLRAALVLTKPSLRDRLLPRPIVGLGAGVDMTGQPRLAVLIGLGWRF